jgi:hypothetical protein
VAARLQGGGVRRVQSILPTKYDFYDIIVFYQMVVQWKIIVTGAKLVAVPTWSWPGFVPAIPIIERCAILIEIAGTTLTMTP